MSSSEAAIQAVKVHVVSSDVPFGEKQPKTARAVYQTVTLTAADPCQPVLPAGKRAAAFIVPLDQAVVIGGNASQVAALAGATVPQNVAWPVLDDGPVYAAPSPALAGTATARITVQATYEE